MPSAPAPGLPHACCQRPNIYRHTQPPSFSTKPAQLPECRMWLHLAEVLVEPDNFLARRRRGLCRVCGRGLGTARRVRQRAPGLGAIREPRQAATLKRRLPRPVAPLHGLAALPMSSLSLQPAGKRQTSLRFQSPALPALVPPRSGRRTPLASWGSSCSARKAAAELTALCREVR